MIYWLIIFLVDMLYSLVMIWGGNYMTEFLKPTSSWLFWDKGTGENDFADGDATTDYISDYRLLRI